MAAHLADHKVHRQLLTRGDEGHLLSDLAASGVVHLRARLAAIVAAPLHPRLPQLGQALPRVDTLHTDA